ncbi:hypothetical protein S40288_09941 [Stachybotrys chartarum IBT 40288]|nr:hypothetical protein S40288_09941 [Stachybotrys chartarum IBT 40288]
MVAFIGKSKLKLTITTKPTPTGFKIWQIWPCRKAPSGPSGP